MIIHSPDHEFFVRINKMLRDFMWDQKSSRISLKQLIRKIEDGGLQLFNLEIKNIAFKSQWIKRSTTSLIGMHGQNIIIILLEIAWRYCVKSYGIIPIFDVAIKFYIMTGSKMMKSLLFKILLMRIKLHF